MRPALVLIAVLGLGLVARPATAQVVSQRPDRVSVVLYQDHAPPFHPLSDDYDGDPFGDDPGLAVVSETRTVDLPAGRTRLSFRGVADGMVAETAAIDGLDGRLIERNYDFDLLSPGTLIEKAVGAPARLVRTNPKTGQTTETAVTVRTGPNGVILQQADGSAEALGCSGLPERLVFDKAPPSLTATPTLSADIETAHAGRHVIRLTYLATGLRWKADYVARLNPDGRTLSLHGWLTLSNVSGTTFGDAPTQVVAGRLAREGEDEPVRAEPAVVSSACWPIGFHFPRIRSYSDARDIVMRSPMAVAAPAPPGAEIQSVVVTGSRIAEVSNLGDYKLYTLPEPTTVAANQTKQVAFLEQTGVSYRKVYSIRASTQYYGDDGAPEPLPIVLKLRNKADQGLGKPLPGGDVTVFEPKPDGAASLGGQSRMKDTPVGQLAEWRMTPSNVVTAQVVQGEMDTRRSGGHEIDRSEVTFTLRNAGRAPAPVEIRLDRSGLKVLSENHPHTLDSGFPLWTVQVPAGGEATLRYRVEWLDD